MLSEADRAQLEAVLPSIRALSNGEPVHAMKLCLAADLIEDVLQDESRSVSLSA